jgi:hypothetical protein
MEQLQDEFSKKIAEQQKQMSQFQVRYLVQWQRQMKNIVW